MTLTFVTRGVSVSALMNPPRPLFAVTGVEAGKGMTSAVDAGFSDQSVVLVDDNSLAREQLAAFLRRHQLAVTEFSEGQSAWDYLLHAPAHLVITNLRLPDMNGLDLLRLLNQHDNPKPVMLMSGIGQVSDVVQALRLGAADYFIKPILDYEVVLHAIEKALQLQKLQQENDAYKQRLETVNQSLAAHVALLEQDQQAARLVQTNLLPRTPVRYGPLELSHCVMPSLYLSGDFVDYGLVMNRYVAFYLTDVAGHGASSALVTVWLKEVVRKLFRDKSRFRSPEDFTSALAILLAEVNTEFMRSRLFSHLTCIVGVIDLANYQLRYITAGHLPLPILCHADGTADYLPGRGKPLGLFAEAEWAINSVQLAPGFRLLLLSDGILETLAEAGLAAQERGLLRALSGQPIHTLDDVKHCLGLHHLAQTPDDIALALIADRP